MTDPAPTHQPSAKPSGGSGYSPASSSPPRSFPPLPTVLSPISAVEATATLDAAARRGKLPGFHKGPPTPKTPDVTFHITDFGTPCESILNAYAQTHGAGCELSFSLQLKPLIPWLFTLVSIFTVWPGIWLTDSMLNAYFPSFAGSWFKGWFTVIYLVLTVPFVPLGTWQLVRKSRNSAHAEALLLITKIQTLVSQSEPPR